MQYAHTERLACDSDHSNPQTGWTAAASGLIEKHIFFVDLRGALIKQTHRATPPKIKPISQKSSSTSNKSLLPDFAT